MWRKITLGGRLKGEYLLFYVEEGFSVLVASEERHGKVKQYAYHELSGKNLAGQGKSQNQDPQEARLFQESTFSKESVHNLSNANTSNVLGPSHGSSCWCVKNIGFFFYVTWEAILIRDVNWFTFFRMCFAL